jgi:amino acid transporter
LVPFILATCFFVVFFTKDTQKSRGKLPYAIILIIVSLSLTAIWTIVYYLAFYKQPVVYVGMNGEYTQSPKKAYVFFRLLQYVILIGVYTYFMCVAAEYKSCMKTERPVDDKKSTGSKKSKASSKKSAKSGSKKGEEAAPEAEEKKDE